MRPFFVVRRDCCASTRLGPWDHLNSVQTQLNLFPGKVDPRSNHFTAAMTLTKTAPDLPAHIDTDDGPVTVFDPGFALQWQVT